MNRTDVLLDRREGHYLDCMRQFGPSYQCFDLINSTLALNLVFTYDLLHQCTSKYMAEYGLSRSTFNVLMLLRHGPPEGMQLHDLGDLLLVSRANITGLISHLEDKGYVTRVVDPTDRRARYARITAKAEELMDQFIPVHFSNISSLLNNLSPADKGELTGLLTKARQSIRENSAVCERHLEAKV